MNESGLYMPVSSAAAAVTTFIVEPGGYCAWVARLSSEPPWPLFSCLKLLRHVVRVEVEGTFAITRTAPVEGSSATIAPACAAERGERLALRPRVERRA